MVEFVQFHQSNQTGFEDDRRQELFDCGEEQASETITMEALAIRATAPTLMPTIRALDETGAKIECFRPLRVHIDGW